jgi:hypothetical protein
VEGPSTQHEELGFILRHTANSRIVRVRKGRITISPHPTGSTDPLNPGKRLGLQSRRESANGLPWINYNEVGMKWDNP